jgi:hypothetical protein
MPIDFSKGRQKELSVTYVCAMFGASDLGAAKAPRRQTNKQTNRNASVGVRVLVDVPDGTKSRQREHHPLDEEGCVGKLVSRQVVTQET